MYYYLMYYYLLLMYYYLPNVLLFIIYGDAYYLSIAIRFVKHNIALLYDTFISLLWRCLSFQNNKSERSTCKNIVASVMCIMYNVHSAICSVCVVCSVYYTLKYTLYNV